uniref:Bm13505 n=1 Tax=Brugia malayi TaxID=6279 RepID=A0A1I9G3K2_BRUMA|nr:Bm13505 [Brugia malayi]
MITFLAPPFRCALAFKRKELKHQMTHLEDKNAGSNIYFSPSFLLN